MAKHNDLGKDAELFVQSYLTAKGYVILDNNWHSGKYELDLVALYGNVIVVIEVKARSADSLTEPYEAVDAKKIKRTVDAAHCYVTDKGFDMDVRFDVLSLKVNENVEGGYEVEHIEDAFMSPLF